MSSEIEDLCRRLARQGWTCERISRCISLPVRDVARVIL